MRFTDLFIRRPLLAWVLNSLILLFGLLAFSYLELRPYPEIESAEISVTTVYPGASADVVQGFVTGPLQRAVIGAEGIDYYTSSTFNGLSTIAISVATGYDPEQVMTDVIGKIATVRGELPPNALDPEVQRYNRGITPVWIRLQDPQMKPEQLTEFFYRVVRPALLTVEGTAGLYVIGEQPFAMRLWLDPVRMAGVGVTAADLQQAVETANFVTEAGEIRDGMMIQPVRAATDINTAKAFSNIVIREHEGALVRMRDVATVELASTVQRTKGFDGGEQAMLVGLVMATDSNPLALSRNTRKMIRAIVDQLPSTMEIGVTFDLGVVVESALRDVTRSLFEALAIVALITLLFFGSLRAILIMLISIPLSLIGTFLVMWTLGYSLNLFTLLALVIAIGLVVDDTIVVVENIHRYIEQGLPPLKAAQKGAQEVVAPVIAMSLTLVAVFLPVGFMEGLSGALIAEFVFTLAGAVAISGVIALTLSPMLCSRILAPHSERGIAHWLDDRFDALRRRYANTLHRTLRYRPVWLLIAAVIIGVIPTLFTLSEQELVPLEDIGRVHVAFSVPHHMSEDFVSLQGDKIEGAFRELPEAVNTVRFEGMMDNGTSIASVELSPWAEREASAMEVRTILQEKLNRLPGMLASAFIMDLSPSGGSGQLPVQLVIRTNDSYENLVQVADRFLQEIRASGNFMFADSDLKFSEPQVQVEIDRDKAGELGVSMAEIGITLSAMLGEGYINRFSYEGESYKVIPQAAIGQRLDRAALNQYYVKTVSGDMIPLGALIETRMSSKPRSRNQFDGLNAATLSMVMSPGVSMQGALDYLESRKDDILPRGYNVDYAGKSRTFLQSGNTLLFTFLLALVTIFLFLVALYESLRDPLVVLVTVPLSLCGALIFLCLDFATLSLFSQVGLITLVGLISKHGILMVDFARHLQEQGLELTEAIIEAASVRLRPVLMTTAAIVMAVIPLVIASGPGAVSRNHIGLVIASGMTIGTLFTLFVLPVVYTYIARRREPVARPDAVEPG